MSELQNELTQQDIISVKGLYALCIIHNINILYIKNRTYYDIKICDKQNKTLFIRVLFIFLKNNKIMARYRGPRVRIIRRVGELPGLTQKTTKHCKTLFKNSKNRRFKII